MTDTDCAHEFSALAAAPAVRNALIATRKVLLNHGYCGAGDHGLGDPEINIIDAALAAAPAVTRNALAMTTDEHLDATPAVGVRGHKPPWTQEQITDEELNLIRQWFNAVEDLAPEYLEDADRDLGKRIEEHVCCSKLAR